MRLKNDAQHYGLVAVILHWMVALTVIGMFALGLWMTSLTYYDPWYRQGPWLHKGIGVTLFFVLIARIIWRRYSPPPKPLASHAVWERAAAQWAHALLYILLLVVMISGYLISTADGRPVEVFEVIEIPALISGIKQQEEIAGTVHLVLASTLIGLAVLHALAALKHHFIDRDRTLLRMLGR